MRKKRSTASLTPEGFARVGACQVKAGIGNTAVKSRETK